MHDRRESSRSVVGVESCVAPPVAQRDLRRPPSNLGRMAERGAEGVKPGPNVVTTGRPLETPSGRRLAVISGCHSSNPLRMRTRRGNRRITRGARVSDEGANRTRFEGRRPGVGSHWSVHVRKTSPTSRTAGATHDRLHAASCRPGAMTSASLPSVRTASSTHDLGGSRRR